MAIPFQLRKIPKIEHLTTLKNVHYGRTGVYNQLLFVPIYRPVTVFRKDAPKTKVPISEVKAKNKSTLSQVTLSRQLLKQKKREKYQDDFKRLLELPTEQYEAVCEALLTNLSNMLQDLPETRNSYFSNRGGFLNHALSRTQAALHACRAYFISDDGRPAKNLSDPQKLWMYTLFSAALLKGIGKLYVDFEIEIYDHSGRHVSRWLPFRGDFKQLGAAFYDYEFAPTQHDSFRKRVTLLLAQQIMPKAGLYWLAKDKNVFEVWLALLESDTRAAGTLGFIMDKADAIAINRFFQEHQAELYNQKEEDDFGLYDKKEDKEELTTDKDDKRELEVGEIPKEGIEFVKWLNRALLTGKLLVNQSPLFMVPGGLLMSPDIFQLFIREHPQFKNWLAVQKGLMHLQLHSGDGISRFKNSKTGQLHSGIVISAIEAVTPAKLQMVNLSNGVSTTITNSQLAQMKENNPHFQALSQTSPSAQQLLSSSGTWLSPQAGGSPLNPGQKT